MYDPGLELAIINAENQNRKPKKTPASIQIQNPAREYVADEEKEQNFFHRNAAKFEYFFDVKVVSTGWFQQLVFVVIIGASVLIGLQTDKELAALALMENLDEFIRWFFAIEMLFKLFAVLRKPYLVFFDSFSPLEINYWNWFDFIVVVLCFLEQKQVAVVRLFRLLRVLKLVKAVPTLKMLLSGLIASMGSIGYILILLMLLFYVFSIVGMMMYQKSDTEHFGTLPITIVTLFAISTGGSWTEVMYPNIFECNDNPDTPDINESLYPHCTSQSAKGWLGVLYFGSFILLSAMVLLNLVIGVITQSMDTARKENAAEAEGLIDEPEEEPEPPGKVKKFIIDILVKLRLRAPAKAPDLELQAFHKGQQGMLRALDAHIELVSRLRITVVNLQKRREKMKKEAARMDSTAGGYCPYRDGVEVPDPEAPGMWYPYKKWTNLMHYIAQHLIFQSFMLATVILAAVMIGIETDEELAKHSIMPHLETAITVVFVIEIVVKTLACGTKPWMFFFESVYPVLELDMWNILDFLVVVASFLRLKEAQLLRLFRLIRILKLIRAIPTLRNLLVGLVKSLGSMFYVFMLLMLLFYIFGILGILVFKTNDPVHFDSLGLAFLTLLQCATGDDWTNILYINMRGCLAWKDYPKGSCKCTDETNTPQPLLSVIYFVIFMLLSAMVTLNLVIGVINSSMEETQEEIKSEEELKNMNLLDDGPSNRGDKKEPLNTASHTQVTAVMTALLKLQDIQLQSLLDRHLLGKRAAEGEEKRPACAETIAFVDPQMFKPPPRERAKNSKTPKAAAAASKSKELAAAPAEAEATPEKTLQQSPEKEQSPNNVDKDKSAVDPTPDSPELTVAAPVEDRPAIDGNLLVSPAPPNLNTTEFPAPAAEAQADDWSSKLTSFLPSFLGGTQPPAANGNNAVI